MEGISNMQKNWKKCGVMEAVDTVLNLPVCLNPVTRDSMGSCAGDVASKGRILYPGSC